MRRTKINKNRLDSNKFNFYEWNFLQSVSISLLSFVPRRSFKDRRLNDPPDGACVPRRNKNGLTFATGRLC